MYYGTKLVSYSSKKISKQTFCRFMLHFFMLFCYVCYFTLIYFLVKSSAVYDLKSQYPTSVYEYCDFTLNIISVAI